MAKCNLDTSDPRFVVNGDASDADFEQGLQELREKLSRDHKLSGFYPHPMPGFPDYRGKVWKWDFAPSGERSSTRKGWRLLAYVENPNGPEPILARAFLCYDKDRQPKGDPAKFIAENLKKFFEKIKKIEAVEDRFRRQDLPDGTIVSMCYACYETIHSPTHDEADINEDAHQCLVLEEPA